MNANSNLIFFKFMFSVMKLQILPLMKKVAQKDRYVSMKVSKKNPKNQLLNVKDVMDMKHNRMLLVKMKYRNDHQYQLKNIQAYFIMHYDQIRLYDNYSQRPSFKLHPQHLWHMRLYVHLKIPNEQHWQKLFIVIRKRIQLSERLRGMLCDDRWSNMNQSKYYFTLFCFYTFCFYTYCNTENLNSQKSSEIF